MSTPQPSHAAQTARWLVTCATLVGGFEGLSLIAYPDKLASNIPTVCYGETSDVKLGDRHSAAECKQMLADDLPQYWHDAKRCTPDVTYSNHEKEAYTSFTYNLGAGNFCHGPGRFLRKGDHAGACKIMLKYDHANGKRVKGLTERRSQEYALCMTPDTPTKGIPQVTDTQPAPTTTPRTTPAKTVAWYWTALGDIIHWFVSLVKSP